MPRSGHTDLSSKDFLNRGIHRPQSMRLCPVSMLIAFQVVVCTLVVTAAASEPTSFPELAPEGDPEYGRILFNGKAGCVSCHGLDANPERGTSTFLPLVSPKPPDLHMRSQLKYTSGNEIFYILKNGIAGTAMIPSKNLSHEEIGDVVAFLGTLYPPPENLAGPPPNGRKANSLESNTPSKPGVSMNGNIDSTIRATCFKKWPTNLQLFGACVSKQREAYYWLATVSSENKSQEHVSPGAKACSQKWPQDFQMQVFCLKKLHPNLQ